MSPLGGSFDRLWGDDNAGVVCALVGYLLRLFGCGRRVFGTRVLGNLPHWSGESGVLFCEVILILVLRAFGCGAIWDACNGVKCTDKAKFTEAGIGTSLAFPEDSLRFRTGNCVIRKTSLVHTGDLTCGTSSRAPGESRRVAARRRHSECVRMLWTWDGRSAVDKLLGVCGLSRMY